MDPYQGFEVGAEVELNDSLAIVEDSAAVKVENKLDLPAWHHLHYIDDSSSDESLDHQLVFSPSFEGKKNMEKPKYVPEVKTLNKGYEQLGWQMFSTSEPFLQNNDPSVEWSYAYNSEDQDQTCPLGPSLEETEISYLEIIPAPNCSPSPTQPTELYQEMITTQEADEAELFGKYSYYNAKTQRAGTLKPWVRSHKCTKCGRQFGRTYNLESHMCIKEALTRVRPNNIMSDNISDMYNLPDKCEQSEESMNRLEKMCAEAQKELHNLQELYKKEEVKPPLSVLTETHRNELVPDNRVLRYKRPFTCRRCGRKFRRRINLGSHVCSSDGKLSFPQPSSSVDLDFNQVDSSQVISTVSKSEDGANQVKVFNCPNCGKVFNRRSSYGTHMRWHRKEKELVTFVNKSFSSGDFRALLTPFDVTSMGLKKKTGPTFTCQECGRVFHKLCSYSTHTLWHVKSRNLASSSVTPALNQVAEGQEMRIEEAQVPSVSAERQSSDKTKAMAGNTFTCQECGRVFHKSSAHTNHTRWHIKERELVLHVKAASQTALVTGDAFAMGHYLKTSSKESSSKALPIFGLDVDQGYGSLANHPNLEEQENLSMLADLDQQKTSAEVPEFIYELVVGTESFHEGFTSTDNQVIQNVEVLEPVEETTSRTQTSSFTFDTNEPSMSSVPPTMALPYEFLVHLFKKPRPPYRCRDCGLCFFQSWRMKCHQNKGAMRSRWKKYQCDCGRTPVGLLHFLRHQLQHLSDTCFICATCGKLLRGYQQLQAHSWVHPLVSQFQCKCGARFRQLPRYLWHSILNKSKERLHARKRPTAT
ncbi:uncharacterized protein [Phyllobates terribilis]|uniref:uncharacterized protein n=1 Tax=Phyllobates terribilis TaxID=111132 RepID=UPI003CCAE799